MTAIVGVALLVSWMLWSSSLAGPDEASAQGVVNRACHTANRAASYDVTGSVKGYVNGRADESFSMTGSVQDDDYQVRYTAMSDGATVEYRRVNGVSYSRSSTGGNQWRTMRQGILKDPGAGFGGLGDNPVCPNTTHSDLRYAGRSLVDGVPARLYAAGQDLDIQPFRSTPSTFRGASTANSYEFWVNSAGQLLQHRQRVDMLRQSTETDRQIVTSVSLVSFKGVGQRNTINAPSVP